ncbi:MAG: hypothetical protein M1343_08165 [Chloroflexi bacterium]|nr:hypothetical protein [Chloroflexota bacterium]
MFTSQTAKVAANRRSEILTPEQRSDIARLGAVAKNAKHPIGLMSRKGGLATLSKLGRDGLANRIAKWRRRNPSNLERIVAAWLDEIGAKYEREAQIRDWYADFAVSCHGKRRRLIEANGHAWHNDNWHGEADKRAERDRAKIEAWTAAGWAVLVLQEKEIKDGTAKGKLIQFVRETDERHTEPKDGRNTETRF